MAGANSSTKKPPPSVSTKSTPTLDTSIPPGPITPLELLHGHGAALASGHHYMAHKTGFTLKTLTQALRAAGFTTSAGKRRERGLDLWVLASKGAVAEETLRELAGRVLPG